MKHYNELIDIDIRGKNILLREDLNVPTSNNEIINDERIRAAIPTIEYILSQNANLSIISHFGRPKDGIFEKELSLKIVAERISKIIKKEVYFEEIPISEKSPDYKNKITLHENTRFLKGETSGDESLAKKMATNCDVFVMDAFGTCHRKHCSTFTVSKYSPITCGGLLLIEEIKNLDKIFNNPKRPILAIIGGAKISTKLSVLTELLNKVNAIIIGGGIANTFLLSSNFSVGNSLSEKSMVENAREIIKLAEKKNVQLPLPEDVVCENQNQINVKKVNDVNENDIIKDIGPKTSVKYKKLIEEAGTILWNGPVGMFEKSSFESGTRDIAISVCKSKGLTVAGGGDTISAVQKFSDINEIDYVSTGGGAFLKYLEGEKLPGIEIIKKL
tara:strand:+ start:888 stop:2051 length:1164 start_codon:yes stop_codon:yes gene_type:complete